MNDVDTRDHFDAVVRDALVADAEHAPRLPSEWPGPRVVTVSAPVPSRRLARHAGWVRVAVAVAAAVVLVAALVFVTRGRDDTTQNDDPATAPAGWVPDGTEFPLNDLGPATTADQPVVAALTRQIGVEGHPTQVLTTSLEYWGNGIAAEWECVSGGGGVDCRYDLGDATWTWSITVTSSDYTREYAPFDLWEVDGLPDDVAFVSYRDGDQQLWQRPIRGFAAFPSDHAADDFEAAYNGPVVVGYDASGNEVGKFGAAQQPKGRSGTVFFPGTTEEHDQLGPLTLNELRSCLTSHGGTFTGGGQVATFSTDVDQIAVWDECVTEVRDIVRHAFEELDR